MKNEFIINIGDGSGDGHGLNFPTLIKCNLTLEEFTNHYKRACNLTGFQWNTNGNYTKREGTWLGSEYKIFNYYQCNQLTEAQIDMFESYDIDVDKDFDEDADAILILFMDFVRISDSNLNYEVIEESQAVFDYSIGYGCFDD